MQLLQQVHLKKVADYFQCHYTPPASERDQGIDDEDMDLEHDLAEIYAANNGTCSENIQQRRLRIIGEVIEKLCPHLPAFSLCLKPANGVWPDGAVESNSEFQERIVCHTYIHTYRCLSALLSQWVMTLFLDEHGAQFLGDLFVKVVHHFRLHKSFNTFLFVRLTF